MFYWIKYVNYIKLFKIQGTGCDNVNVLFMWSQSNGLLIYLFIYFFFFTYLNSGTFPVFNTFEKKMVKSLVKILWSFGITLFIRLMLLFFITYIWQLWLIKIIQSSAGENAKGNVMCIAIIMTHQWLTVFPIWHC